MKTKKRAYSADDKAEKCGTILAAAGELILERDYRDLTMADIAVKAKVAKGTLFLYFKSKEELFLALTAGYFRTFFTDLESAISSATCLAGKAEKAQAILSAMTRHIGDDPGFLKMIVLLGPIIEKNVAYGKILEMKRFMLERMKSLGASLEEALPGMGKGAGVAFLMRVYGIAVGYLNLANPASCAKQVIENEELAAFRFDFRKEFEETAAILLKGML
jgi:TetR/AcrR family transcriptional regulator